MGSEILEIFHMFHIPALGIRVGWPDAGMALGKICVSVWAAEYPWRNFGRARYVENTWRLSEFCDHVEDRRHSETLACGQ